MNPPSTRALLPTDPPSDGPLPPPSDDPLPAPEEPAPDPEEGAGPAEPAPEPEITDDPLPPPEDEREDEPRGGRQEPTEPPDTPVELDSDDKVFDCGLTDGGCHVSNWFADFVISGLNPALEWVAERAFWTPMPTEGMQALHTGILTTANILYLLLIVAGAVIAMGYQTIQTRYSATDLLPRLVAGFAASNLSMWISTEIIRLSNDMASAIGAMGIDAREAAENLRERMDIILVEAVLFTVLLLVVIVVLLVVWMISEAVRICVVIVLVVGAPLLLMFHALPHTTRLAELWWKSLVGACVVPIAQAVAFLAMMQLFFEGQMSLMGNDTAATSGPGKGQMVLDTGSEHTVTLAGSTFASPETGSASGDGWLMNIMLLLVLLYVQIRIGSWVSRLVWQPNPGTSPIAALVKNIGWMLAFRSLGAMRLPKAFDFGLRRTHLAWPKRTPGKPLPRYHPKPGSGLQPLQSQAWWYRHRHDPPDPVGDLTTAGRRTLPGPGAGGPGPRPGPSPDPGTPPPALPGQKALPPVPPPRPGSPAPVRRVLEEGRMPGSPVVGQQTLFAQPSPPTTAPSSGNPGSPRRRWRQGVLPTPPPVRIPGRKGVERLGTLPPISRPSAGLRHLPNMPVLDWSKPPHVKGQRPLFASPRRVWKQYGLFPKLRRNTK